MGSLDEAKAELRAAWRDLGVLILVILADSWLGRKLGMPQRFAHLFRERDAR